MSKNNESNKGRLSGAIEQLVEMLERNLNNHALLERMATMETKIMSAIGEFAEKQTAFNDRLDADISGFSGDIKTLNDKIDALQNSARAITPEDQALLTDIETRSDAIATKVERWMR